MKNNELNHMLAQLRMRRKFDVEECLQAKIALLNDYFRKSNLKACVVGVSGGVDSALALALVQKAAQENDSPIQKIVAALLPVFASNGASNQDVALERGREVARTFDIECALVDLTSSHQELKNTVDRAVQTKGNAWAAGQLVSYLRTPALFYLTSLLAQQQLPAIVCGTTNRDEGSYIGYFGKAADGMVDLQVISDLHKSEVFALSKYLGVPESVLTAEPTGDIYDGRNDEQLIGAPYDFIELYTLFMTLLELAEQEQWRNALSQEARNQFEKWSVRLDTLNKQCAHKYLGGSPSVHLDVYERAVPGGWEKPKASLPPVDHSTFVNEFNLDPEFIKALQGELPSSIQKEVIPIEDVAYLMHGLLNAQECAALLANLERQEWVPVGTNGYLQDYQPGINQIGSYRASCYSKEFADHLWLRLLPYLSVVRVMDTNTATDWDGCPVWRAVGVSSLMRFIRYPEGGALVPHYDAPYIYNDERRTLMSVIVYLTNSKGAVGGVTRFIADPERQRPLAERNYNDWNRFAKEKEVLCSISPNSGTALIFDHRILHDSEVLSEGAPKIILRTDIIFEQCGLSGGKNLTSSKPLGFPG
jgi:NAD+ synthetase